MTDDLKFFNPAGSINGVYFHPMGSEEWIYLGPVEQPEPVDGPVEVRRRIPVTKILSRSDGVEVDVTDEFDLDHSITLTAAFPTIEEAEAFARRWGEKEDT